MDTENKPKPGAMQIKDGKMRLFMGGEWVDFGVSYVAADMRKIARSAKLQRSPYILKIRTWAGELDHGGMFSVRSVQEKLKGFFGASEQWMAQDCRVWHGWLQQICQIWKNWTGKKDAPVQKEANEKFRGNFDTIFQKVA
jgi:hypothetical protein